VLRGTTAAGRHVNGRRTTICACACVAVIIALNAVILVQQLRLSSSGHHSEAVWWCCLFGTLQDGAS
jgi:hypothetical protein